MILLLDEYSTGIDIWSVGCIFAELLSMVQDNFATFTDRRPLFPGDSCFTLSPSESKNLEQFPEIDQLKAIF